MGAHGSAMNSTWSTLTSLFQTLPVFSLHHPLPQAGRFRDNAVPSGPSWYTYPTEASAALWARATSEFGAIVIVTYHPRVASVLAYDRYVTYGLRSVLPVAAALVCVALGILLMIRMARRPERA